MRRALSVIAAVSLMLLFAVPFAGAADIDLVKAKATFEAACGKCHGVDRPLGVAGRDAEGWKSAVSRMSGYNQGKFGAAISAPDQAAIVEYLVINAGKKP